MLYITRSTDIRPKSESTLPCYNKDNGPDTRMVDFYDYKDIYNNISGGITCRHTSSPVSVSRELQGSSSDRRSCETSFG